MNTLGLSVIACERVFYQKRAQQVIIPLYDGAKAIQPHHENMVFAIEEGEIKIQDTEGNWILGIVGKGFAQVTNNRVSILVDTAEYPEEIDVRRAEEAKERAEERLRQKQSIQEYYINQAALARALTRLRYSRKH